MKYSISDSISDSDGEELIYQQRPQCDHEPAVSSHATSSGLTHEQGKFKCGLKHYKKGSQYSFLPELRMMLLQQTFMVICKFG